MSEIKSTALFIGNRDCFQVKESDIEAAIIQAIASGIDTFLSGGQGHFDQVSATVLSRVKSNYPHVKSILVIPYNDFKVFNKSLFNEIVYPFDPRLEKLIGYKKAIPMRNRVMVENSSLAICYVQRFNGGAAKTLDYAIQRGLRIIDLTVTE